MLDLFKEDVKYLGYALAIYAVPIGLFWIFN